MILSQFSKMSKGYGMFNPYSCIILLQSSFRILLNMMKFFFYLKIFTGTILDKRVNVGQMMIVLAVSVLAWMTDDDYPSLSLNKCIFYKTCNKAEFEPTSFKYHI